MDIRCLQISRPLSLLQEAIRSTRPALVISSCWHGELEANDPGLAPFTGPNRMHTVRSVLEGLQEQDPDVRWCHDRVGHANVETLSPFFLSGELARVIKAGGFDCATHFAGTCQDAWQIADAARTDMFGVDFEGARVLKTHNRLLPWTGEDGMWEGTGNYFVFDTSRKRLTVVCYGDH